MGSRLLHWLPSRLRHKGRVLRCGCLTCSVPYRVAWLWKCSLPIECGCGTRAAGSGAHT